MSYSQAFLDLIKDPKAAKVYLISVDGYVDELATTRTFRFSNRAFVTEPTDTPANTIFAPRLDTDSVFVYERSMFSSGKIGGRSIPGSIRVSIINLDGAYDAFRRHGFDGRTMTIKLGGIDWSYADFVTISTSVIESVEVTTERVTFLGRDLQFLLDKPIQTTLFAGTGGHEGSADLKGKEKPRSYGVIRNGEPVFLGMIGPCMAWKINDGAVAAYDSSIHRLYDRGVPLTYEAANPPSSGKWTLDATNAVLLYNGTTNGPVTADWKGDATGSGYVSTLADIARRIVTGPGGIGDPSGLDTASFTQLNTDQPGACGIFIRQGGNILEALDYLFDGLGCFYGFTRAGLVQVGQFKAPSGAAVLELTDNEIISIERVPVARPIWRQVLGYQRCWRLQSDSEITDAYADNITNGQFAVDANWTKGTGWTISGGVANAAAGSASDLSQAQSLVIGQVYRLSFDLTRSAGTLQPKIDATNLGSSINASGSYVLEFTATATSQTLNFSKDSSFAGTIDNVVLRPARVDFVANEFRTVSAEDTSVQTKHPRSEPERIDCALDSSSDATTEVSRRLNLHKVDRDIFSVVAKTQPFQVELNDVVSVTIDRFELDAGEDFRVIEIVERAGQNEIEVLIWG